MNENEQIPAEEIGEKSDITLEKIIEACDGVVDKEAFDDLEDWDIWDVIAATVGLLQQAGIEDGEAYLIEKGILEKSD